MRVESRSDNLYLQLIGRYHPYRQWFSHIQLDRFWTSSSLRSGGFSRRYPAPIADVGYLVIPESFTGSTARGVHQLPLQVDVLSVETTYWGWTWLISVMKTWKLDKENAMKNWSPLLQKKMVKGEADRLYPCTWRRYANIEINFCDANRRWRGMKNISIRLVFQMKLHLCCQKL